MKSETWLLIGVALVVGVLVGVLVTHRTNRPPAPQTAAAPSMAAPAANVQQNITMLEDLVRKEPGNRNAWVQLGNTYFDIDQPVKAVDAYGKALELDGNDPDVLTDQGVMFRKLGWYDRAIANFNKANQINPSHQPSLYNLGVVYRFDLKNVPKAQEAWERFMKLNPTGPGADQVRRDLETLKNSPPLPAGSAPRKP